MQEVMAQPLKIAILAMGGEGGGVLADWLVDLAEHNGHVAQTTSVPGVAQRTGATIYYVEMFPRSAVPAGQEPVLALMPMPGDVDVVLASEWMEAGRAVQRGLVTPERTALIASTHRVYAIAERSAAGDARVSGEELLAHIQAAARSLTAFDMAALAARHRSAISAVLMGALAGRGLLPFARAAFEDTIRRGGVGVTTSLAAFDAAFAAAQSDAPPGWSRQPAQPPEEWPLSTEPSVQTLQRRAMAEWPHAHWQGVLRPALRRLVDYQDVRYAHEFLDRMGPFAVHAGQSSEVVRELMRHLALWMSYEDVVRVADIKTRAERFAQVQSEVRAHEEPAPSEQVWAIDEFLHPRLQEIADTLPVSWGRWLLQSGAPRRWLERHAVRARVHRSTSLRGYLALRLLAGLKPWRRGSLRHALESARIDDWLEATQNLLGRDAALALEWVRCQGLVRGYGDTHTRGLQRFERLRQGLRELPHIDATTLRALREAAQADEDGQALEAAWARAVRPHAAT